MAFSLSGKPGNADVMGITFPPCGVILSTPRQLAHLYRSNRFRPLFGETWVFPAARIVHH